LPNLHFLSQPRFSWFHVSNWTGQHFHQTCRCCF
jgi:hypothetical protein